MGKTKAPNFKAKVPQGVMTPEVAPEVEQATEVEATVKDETVQEDSNPNEDAVGTETNEEVTTEDTPEVETKEEEPKVVFVEDTTSKTVPDTNVKIKVGREYSCVVGGVRYFFEKDKVQTVPKNVKAVLSKEDNLLKPL